MRRRHLIEIEDTTWCPAVLRDGGTDWLAFMANTSGWFAAAAPKIRQAMVATGTNSVLDLCSGGGGPWLSLAGALEGSGDVRVELSDRFPNLRAFEALRLRSGGRLGYRPESIDATNVPAHITGVRTMFNGFHHFHPPVARAILADAVAKRRAIAVFEGVSHRGLGMAGLPLQLPAILLLTPFIRPFRWSRLALTYALPVIPGLVLFDGAVSVLRIYKPDELCALVKDVPDAQTFDWDIGVTRVSGTPLGFTHLIGTPRVSSTP
jgi:hypothetical protein